MNDGPLPDVDLRPSTATERLRLAPDVLRWTCDASELSFDSTADVEPEHGIIGQDDALEALRYGLEFFGPGQNVYVRGLTGTGRQSLVRRVLEEIQPACPLASDHVFVANFDAPAEPLLVTLPRGRGFAFREAMEDFIRFLRRDLGPALQSEEFRARRRFLDERFEAEGTKITEPFEAELKESDLALVSVKTTGGIAPAIVPLIEGEPAPPERMQQLLASGALTQEQVEGFQKKVASWAERLEQLAISMRELGRRHAEEARDLLRGEVRRLVEGEVRCIRDEFPSESAARFLDSVVENVVHSDLEELVQSKDAMRRFEVNVVLGHRPDEGCPVIVETIPTLVNLLGSVDRRVLPGGNVVSDHLMINAGSLLRASGGYLVIEAREILREPGAWKMLVRTLRAGKLEIVPSELQGPWATRTLKPEAIPIDVKVIMIGDPGLYYLLDSEDSDFPHLFKVLADFDSSIERSIEGVETYAALLSRIVQDEHLPHFDRTGVAALAEHGARIAGRNTRLTTRFGRLVDIAREAAFLASKSTHNLVTGEDVLEAIRRGKRRGDLPARKFRERVADGTIHIQTRGTAIGEVNGLAVIHAGPLVYGFPARITSTIGAGHAGMINIERESQLSGAIHTKGFYILGGLLRHLLQTQHPLAFSASIAFEQSYGGIDGDSASGAEMCCLISSLTGLPLRQDLAMTGAIDQHGRILPIGAATEKVEGFFDACVDLGLTGTQGVILPRANVGDLMLRADVVEACAEGRFHVYAVETIQEALELFTGVEAGTRDPGGEYEPGTVLALAVDRAFEFWALASVTPTWETEEVQATPEPPGEPGAATK